MTAPRAMPRRLMLARLPTPVQLLKRISKEVGKEIYIWRDDLTGCVESGNKVRKLEFLLADALEKGCDTVITCGGPQSNHTRATSAMARQLGLGVTILTAPPLTFDRDRAATANLLLNQIFGAEIRWIDQPAFQKAGAVYDVFLQEEAERLRAAGKKPYVIPLGGSNAIGALGYRNAVAELAQSWKAVATGAPSSLFCALGSAGTFVGLQWGLQEQGMSQTQLWGVNVIGSSETAHKYRTQVTLASEHAYGVKLEDGNAHTLENYWGAGYAIASDDDLRFYHELAQTEGILLDPCYTGKAFRAMLAELKREPKLHGEKILFLHSGGTMGNFAYADQYQKILKPGQK